MAREGAALWRTQRRKGCACDSIHKRMPGDPDAGFTDVCGVHCRRCKPYNVVQTLPLRTPCMSEPYMGSWCRHWPDC